MRSTQPQSHKRPRPPDGRHRHEPTSTVAATTSHPDKKLKSKDDASIAPQHAESVAFRPLPPLPTTIDPARSGCLVLFYQYQEPQWTEVQHKKVLRDFLQLARTHQITGRGRVAPEGVNCTLTGSTPQSVRSFCQALREYDPIFEQTDFKLTDHLEPHHVFKSLSVRKTLELVAYGMEGPAKAPLLGQFAGQHVTAPDFHEAMQNPNTVVVDVRNAYETALGHFVPPPGGARWLDPQLRHSMEFPQWLAQPETQQQLHGKQVFMYCTGGIRCERATALVNQMAHVAKTDRKTSELTVNSASTAKTEKQPKNPIAETKPQAFQPAGVYELQGGIERYLKTFPKGGFWQGKNYLFDRRREQAPELVDPQKLQVPTKCVLCQGSCPSYRNGHVCATQVKCGVPVPVCNACHGYALKHKEELQCQLCQQGYQLPSLSTSRATFLENLKRRAAESLSITNDKKEQGNHEPDGKATNPAALHNKKQQKTIVPNRLFVSRLPLNMTKTKLQDMLQVPVVNMHWWTDSSTGAFYGSCVVEVASAQDAQKVLSSVSSLRKRNLTSKLSTKNKKKKKPRRNIKVEACFTFSSDESFNADSWPPMPHYNGEYPPLGNVLE